MPPPPAPAAAIVDGIIDRLVDAGGRRTPSRRAVVEAVVTAGGHVTADAVADAVRPRFPSVNLSTVYRTLEALEGLGILDHVHLGHGRAVYHLAEEGHQHLYCDRCERVESLPLAELRPLFQLLEHRYGFRADDRHFAIVGRCADCRRREEAGGR